MKCNEYISSISEYIKGRLTPSQKEEMDKHSFSCPSCKKETEEEKSLSLLFKKAELDEEVPSALVISVLKKVDEAMEKDNRSFFDFIFTRRGLTWSTGVYVLGLAVLLMSYLGTPQTASPQPSSSIQEVKLIQSTYMRGADYRMDF